MRLVSTAALFILCALGACHHHGEDDDDGAVQTAASSGTGAGGPSDVVTQAHQEFWDTFYAGEYDQIAAVIDTLKAAEAESPDNGQTALLLGLSHMWALGENERNPELMGPDLFLLYQGAEEHFERALELVPADGRPHGWLGAIRINVGTAVENPELIAEGEAGIEQSKQYNEMFGTFVEALRYQELPVSDPGYDHGVDLMFHVLDLCVGETLDRDNPDYAPYMDQWTSEGEKRICWSIPEAPHSFEGFQATMAELVLKQGDVAAAGVFFDNVRLAPDYDSWPLKARFEARIDRDLHAEIPLLQDDDLENDPESFEGPYGCGSCHATSIPE